MIGDTRDRILENQRVLLLLQEDPSRLSSLVNLMMRAKPTPSQIKGPPAIIPANTGIRNEAAHWLAVQDTRTHPQVAHLFAQVCQKHADCQQAEAHLTRISQNTQMILMDQSGVTGLPLKR